MERDILKSLGGDYALEIPQEEADRMDTFGDLHQYILENAEPAPPSDEVWKKISERLRSEFGLTPEPGESVAQLRLRF